MLVEEPVLGEVIAPPELLLGELALGVDMEPPDIEPPELVPGDVVLGEDMDPEDDGEALGELVPDCAKARDVPASSKAADKAVI